MADSLDDAKAAFRAAWERRALDRWCAREPGRREGPLSVLFISLVECSYRVPLVEIFGEIAGVVPELALRNKLLIPVT